MNRRLAWAAVLTICVGLLSSTPKQVHGLEATAENRTLQAETMNHLIDDPLGFELDLPADMTVDRRYSPAFIRAANGHLDIKISQEQSPYDDIDMYFSDYLNRFIASDAYEPYRTANRIRLLENDWREINGRRVKVVSFTRTPAPGGQETQNQYLFAYIVTGRREFYSLFFRTDSLADRQAAIDQVLDSFDRIESNGEKQYGLALYPVLPKWNAETRAFYEQLEAARAPMWGVFSPWAVTASYAKVAELEQKLDFRFDLLLHYVLVADPFPAEGMQMAYERGQTVQLTMQVAGFNNDNSPSPNANFDLLNGKYDNTLRQFARAARAFGHPFLFRLNNEMNTDWAQYSGVLTLSDPDIYIKVWRRVYRIFQEEGVENAIWVFNPNERSYPPAHWNSQLAYYPGNEYVQVIGLTGYNTGDYNRFLTGETWRSFDEIYAPLAEEYRQVYGRFPWMITEFASSSVGGDKPEWIREMFAQLPDYPEIKAAVWWNWFDPDTRPGKENIAARRYWLDETPETLAAFRAGLAQQSAARPAPGDRFADLAGHWALSQVNRAAGLHLVAGYPDGSFRPGSPVTRAEFLKLAVQVLGLTPRPGTGGFADVEGHWLSTRGYLQAAVDAGLVVPDDFAEPGAAPYYQPDKPMTRLEVAVLAVRVLGRQEEAVARRGTPLDYIDPIPYWTSGSVAVATSAGIMQGYQDGTFGGARILTRAEAAVVDVRLLEAAGSGGGK